ncbi:hypothetical protein AB0N87_28360 [Streptomyces sp. NPDC093228]|uniref:hypothetical protein n=1 Tax=Streptomyces sp. NPDC093228 TaxID=3155070 RepID=UPI00343496DA
MNRRQQRAARNATARQTVNGEIPDPWPASLATRLALLDSDDYDHAAYARQSTLYRAGLDWRTYPQDWPVPSVLYDQGSQRWRIRGDSGWLSPDEWLAVCERAVS